MRYILLLCLLAALPLSALDRTVAGLYVPANEDWPAAIGRITLSRMSDPANKQSFWENHRKLREEGKRQYYIFQLNFARPEGWKYPLPPWENAKAQIDAFFRSDDNVKTYPELIYAITPHEENITWGGQIELMNQIYDYITATYGIKVFQWLSEPLEPRLDIRADGWVMDAYSIQGEKFFRHLQKFVLCGKPVVPVVWASEPFGKYYEKDGIQGIFRDAGSQMDYCAELNLPVILFAVSGKKENFGSVNVWLKSNDSPYVELREFFFGKLAEIKEGKFNTQEHPLIPVKFAPNPQGKYQFKTEFNKFAFVNDCHIQNVHALQLASAGTTAKSDGTVLEWLWESSVPVTSATLNLTADGTVNTEFIVDGRKANAPFRNFRTLHVRLMPQESAVLKSLELQVDIPFTRNPPTAWTGELKETFKDDSFIADWHCTDAPTFSSGPGGLGISPRKGYSARWDASRHFRAEKPVRGLELTVQCGADAANWNSAVMAGISLDGKDIRWNADTAKLDRKQKRFNLTIPARFDAPVNEFYIHLQLRDGSGANSKNRTASIQSLTLKELD